VKKISLLFLFLLLFGQKKSWAKIERDISVKLVEERVNQRLFCYRLDKVTGTKVEKSKKEQWFVDGQEVAKDAYGQMLDEARLVEIKEGREREYKAQLAHDEFKETQRVALTKKLLKKTILDVEEKCSQFDRYQLAEYMSYDASTVESEIDFSNISVQHLEPARYLLAVSDDEFSLHKAEMTITALEKYPVKLQVLFENTVKNAIHQCDDTERLKKLLEIVS
jgi:hypothetical protein